MFTSITFFFEIPKWESQIGTLVVPKIWKLISFSNQIFLKHAKEISYNLQKDLSNSVSHAPIRYHLTLVLKGFGTLDPDLSYDHN